MTLLVAGLNHKTAPVELREQLAVNSSDLVPCACFLKSDLELEEVVILSTCTRVEIYIGSSRKRDLPNSLLRSLCAEPHDFQHHTYFYEDFDAVRHLFQVASGLDSMVIGETKITGQVKEAYEIAHRAQLTGRTLNRLFQTAFQVAKEIRTHTGIGRGAASIGGAAVELAEKLFAQNLSNKSITILGAGQMGEACFRHLIKRGARSIMVSNRSFDRAVELARKFGGRAVRFEERLTAIAEADIVVASTGCPKTLVSRADLEPVKQARRNRPLILIDISVPRNVEPAVQKLDNVYLYNIDDLNAIVCENIRNREQELAFCNQLIEARATTLMEKFASRKAQHHETGLQFQTSWLSQVHAVGAA